MQRAGASEARRITAEHRSLRILEQMYVAVPGPRTTVHDAPRHATPASSNFY